MTMSGEAEDNQFNTYYEPWEFDNKTLKHLHNNDPHLDSLHMFSGIQQWGNPLKIDWGREGSAISIIHI